MSLLPTMLPKRAFLPRLTGSPQGFIALVCACLLALPACKKQSGTSSTGEAGQDPTKVFQYLRASAHKSLDPARQFDGASADLINNVYDTLLEYHYLKRPYTLVPNLLKTMPELSADKLTYTFELRRGIKFHDDPCFPEGKGRELVTDDIIYSLKRFADANVNLKSYMLIQGSIVGIDDYRKQTKSLGSKVNYDTLSIAGLKKLDRYRFTIQLTKTNPLALYPLAASPMSIVAREAVKHYGQDFERHPVGTGPFILSTFSRRGEMVLKKNPSYHGTYPTEGMPHDKQAGLLRDAGKKLPLIDEIRLPLIEEPQPAMLKFLRGRIDWIGLDKDNFNKMAYKNAEGFHLNEEYAKNFHLYTEPFLSSEYLSINLKDSLLGKNKALRQAIAYSLSIAEWITKMRNGRGVPLNTIVPIPIAGSERDTHIRGYETNLKLARQKLVEAGFPEGKGLPPLVIEYRGSTTSVRQDFEFHRAQLAKVGIVLKANFQTFSAFLKKVDSGNFQIASAGWSADYPDAENFFQLVYGPNRLPGPNESSYDNPTYNTLYQKSRYMENGAERYKIFSQMAEIIREDVPIIVTWNPIALGLYQKWISNMKRNMMVDAPFKYLNVDAPAKAKGLQG